MQETKLLQRLEFIDLKTTLSKALHTEGFTLNGVSFTNKPYKLPYMKQCYAKGNEHGMALNPLKRFNIGTELDYKQTTLFEVIYDVLDRMKQDRLNQYCGDIYIEDGWLVIESQHRKWWKSSIYGFEYPNMGVTQNVYKFKILEVV